MFVLFGQTSTISPDEAEAGTLKFYLPRQLFQGIRRKAKRLGMSRSDYIRSLLSRDLEEARRLRRTAV
jgi:Ribbon-helix-helix protein, copG family